LGHTHPVVVDDGHRQAADAEARPAIMTWLTEHQVPFLDVGMGIEETDGHLSDLLRVTTHFPRSAAGPPLASAPAAGGIDEYDRNIQTADLNAVNALLAVIAWKKHLGYYADHTHAIETLYKVFTGDPQPGGRVKKVSGITPSSWTPSRHSSNPGSYASPPPTRLLHTCAAAATPKKSSHPCRRRGGC
jgi:hypothetical protein